VPGHTDGLRCAHVFFAVVDEEEVCGCGVHGGDAVVERGRFRLGGVDLPGEGDVVQVLQPGLGGTESVRVIRGNVGEHGDLGAAAQGLHVGDHVVIDA
jgi:hypothetical protein